MRYEIPASFDEANPLPASPTLRRFTVVPRLPLALERVRDLAHNLFWVWTPVVRELFVRIDPVLYEEVQGSPIDLLSRVKQGRLDELAEDDAFLSHLDTAHAALQVYLSSKDGSSARSRTPPPSASPTSRWSTDCTSASCSSRTTRCASHGRWSRGSTSG